MRTSISAPPRYRIQISGDVKGQQGSPISLESLGPLHHADSIPLLGAIDFEGSTFNKSGVIEFGISTVDFAGARAICTTNYVTSNRRKRKCKFGDIIRTSTKRLPECVARSLRSLEVEGERRDIILVCHGIHNEIDTMDRLGVAVEDLPITGMADTLVLAGEVLGQEYSLYRLIEILEIERRYNSLHCAGESCLTRTLSLAGLIDWRMLLLS
jgi:hypothetical protein